MDSTKQISEAHCGSKPKNRFIGGGQSNKITRWPAPPLGAVTCKSLIKGKSYFPTRHIRVVLSQRTTVATVGAVQQAVAA